MRSDKSPLLLLAPTSIVGFNICGKIIHSALKIPMKDMKLSVGQDLVVFQEAMRHIWYFLIDDMIFTGPRIFIHIYSRLREAFPKNKDYPFGSRFLILVGDLGKLPPIKDKPLHEGRIIEKFLWKSFNIVVTLDKIYSKQGDDLRQTYFHNLLTNIINIEAFSYWFGYSYDVCRYFLGSIGKEFIWLFTTVVGNE